MEVVRTYGKEGAIGFRKRKINKVPGGRDWKKNYWVQ